MSDQILCPRCGAQRPAPLLQGLCPECLLKMTLEGPGSAPQSCGTEGTASFHPVPGSEATARATPLPEIGQQFGDYRIGRRLGQGGMGVVYEADHLPSGRRVALKVLSRALDSTEHRRRFLREGRLAASVSHPRSVYIFGTEEIEGCPVISMELVPGGTLQQRVKEHGPLPVTEAVDVILQIMAGLEAAQAVGVLHRDIKPANCFLDTDGAVKIGDFGLSISTTGRDESFLTAVGSILGTPAFCSPEQLRGDELNVRSDIYAVGVTLYYLLTGRTPFEADNLVKLLATVLEQPAPSPQQWRPEIPAPLARAVLRCLEKQPERRFGSYEELRQALVPFSLAAPTPAPLRYRFLAGFVDNALTQGMDNVFILAVGLASLQYLSQERTVQAVSVWLLYRLLVLLYFAVPEGLWGTTLGKWLCGLRVVGPDRDVPGVARALVRAAIYSQIMVVPYLIEMLFLSGGQYRELNAQLRSSLAGSLASLLWLLLFVTMRRRNGWATVHDLISRTRVVTRPKHLARPGLATAAETAVSTEGAAQVGPYHVLETLPTPAGETVLLGYDARLMRKVWIRQIPGGTPPVATELRNLGRPGRLRWLSGGRSGESWDAYEAPTGKPLVGLLGCPQPWAAVRGWLLDLAEELNIGLRENALPQVLALDRVWITADGRAKLLDFPVPGSHGQDAEASPTSGSDFAAARAFLHQVAVCALEGRTLDAQQAGEHSVAVPLPLHASAFFRELTLCPGPELPADKLGQLMHRPATISRRRRLATMTIPLIYTALTVAFGIYMGGLEWRKQRQWSAEDPDRPPLEAVLQALDVAHRQRWTVSVPAASTPDRETAADGQHSAEPPGTAIAWVSIKAPTRNGPAEDEDALQIYLVGRYHDIIMGLDPSKPPQDDFPHFDRIMSYYAREKLRTATQIHPWVVEEIVRRALAAHPNPTAEELAKATPEAEGIIAILQRVPLMVVIASLVLTPWGTLSLCGVVGLVTTLLLGRGLHMVFLDVAIVNRRGAKASRLRTLCRNLVCLAPLLGVLPLIVVVFVGGLGDNPVKLAPLAYVVLAAISVPLAVYLFGAAWSVWSPECGLQDRLAGTRLVRG